MRTRKDAEPVQAPGFRYRCEGESCVVVELERGKALLAERGRLVYRVGEVGWELAAESGWRPRDWFHRMHRRAVGMAARLDRYSGPGEVCLGTGAPGVIRAVELTGAKTVVAQAESVVAMSEGVWSEIVLARRMRGESVGGQFILLRLAGEGVVFLCAHGSAMEVDLAFGEVLETACWAAAWYDGTADLEVVTATRRGRGSRRGSGEELTGFKGPGRVTVQSVRPSKWVR